MHDYVAFGLRVRSSVRLPELPESAPSSEADITVKPGVVKIDRFDERLSRTDLLVSPDGNKVELVGVARYWISGGSRIVFDPMPGADDGLVRLNLLGLALGLLLHQRGLLVLHGSAVGIGGRGVAFLGYSGSGKSTMAAALRRRGGAIVTDDIAAIEFDRAGDPFLQPGFPELRLWPDSIQSLQLGESKLHRVHGGTEKRGQRDLAGFARGGVPLDCIYIVAPGERNEINPIRPAGACAEFLRHSFVGGILRPTNTAEHHFRQCARLAKRVRVARLSRSESLDGLDELSDMIEDDVQGFKHDVHSAAS
ncbi:MAG: hypothetical protein ABSB33_04770 [Tepidisphaeraceae bacterium]